MGSLIGYLLIYTIGGLTFPLVLLATLFAHAYLALPVYEDINHRRNSKFNLNSGHEFDIINRSGESLNEKLPPQESHEAEVAAGYFAVSRDYIPGGINGRPPERTSPIGLTTVSAPSQSVYQSMYRSLFERKPSGSHHDKVTGKPPKKGGNIFYVVLRHGHLLLFDDDEQLEVRHVVSLAHYNVSIYSGEDETPEGELFIKRNALCLSRRADLADITTDGQVSKPFFLFSDNCSDKEDFYFALLRSQEKKPKPLHYETKDIITLVQKLHSSEEHLQTRWINAVMGRIFLALYKTPEIERCVRAKIKKKISRVKTPAFLSKITLRNIDMGESAPIITNPKLKDLNIDGELVVEADVRYSGNFRIEVAAIARLDLGTRFKAREVNLLLAVNLKRIEGHLLIKIKPPPSNRFWLCFQTQPRIDMTIEPIVSTRQITYTLILRQIENRIKEVIAESFVFPNWDDSPFFRTEKKSRRGGIWADDNDHDVKIQKETETAVDTDRQSQSEKSTTTAPDCGDDDILKVEGEEASLSLLETDLNTPLSTTSLPNNFNIRKSSSVFSFPFHKSGDSPASHDTQSHGAEKSSNPLCSAPFPSSPSPIVSTDSTTADAFKSGSITDNSHAIAAFSALSQINSPPHSLVGSSSLTSRSGRPERPETRSSTSSSCTGSERECGNELQETQIDICNITKPTKISLFSQSKLSISKNNPKIETVGTTVPRSLSTGGSGPDHSTSSHGQSSTIELKRLSIATMNNAAATAKKWSMFALQRNNDQKNESPSENSPSRPLVMGRGQPLPPPGVPLPLPGKKPKTPLIPVPKRKMAPSPEVNQKKNENGLALSANDLKENVLSQPLNSKVKQKESLKELIESTANGNLRIVPMPNVDSDVTSRKDEQSSLIASRSSSILSESPDQTSHRKSFGSLGENRVVIPFCTVTPESEVRARNVFIEEDI